jgi:hypothetical protein
MSRVILFSTVLFFFPLFSFTQPSWEKIIVGENVTISFPGKPTGGDRQGFASTFIYKQPDSSANYIVAVNDLAVSLGLDAETIAREMERDESLEQAKNAFVGSIGPAAKLIREENIKLHGGRALKLVIHRLNNKGATNVLTVLIFVNETNSYNVIFVSVGGRGNENMKQQFFDSIQFKN